MSENLELVRSIFEPVEQGDFGDARWADREIEYTIVDGLEPGSFKGREGLVEAMHETLRPWERVETHVDRYRELDSQRVLVLTRVRGRGKASGMALEALSSDGAQVVHIRDGKVTRIDVYYDRHRALADLGLAG
jgi:ketosteroid isomerase-like protein